MQRHVGNFHPADVRDVLALRQLAVDVQSGQRLVGRILRDDRLRAVGVSLRGFRRPPIAQITDRIVLPAAIVESVSHFMSDHGPDAAIIHGVVRFRVEEWRLKNARWENNLVPTRVVIRIHRRRRHAPFAAIDRLADLRQLAVSLEGRTVQHIHRIRIAIDCEQRVVAPFVGISNLHREGRQLFQRFLLGCVVHPVQRLDPVGQRLAQIVHQLECAHLRFRREIIGHVKFAETFAQFFIRLRHHAFPARLQLLRARQGFAEEIEIFLNEFLREHRSRCVEHMPAQINFPVVHRRARKNLIRGLEEFRLADIDITRLDEFYLLEVIVPLPVRSESLEIGLLHFVVVLLRIAQLHARPRRLRQRRFDGEHFLRVLRRLILRLAEQREHLRHVLHVLVADLFRTGVVLRVVIPVGQRESALERLTDHHLAVLRVLVRAETEERRHPDRVQVRDLFQNVAALFHRIDSL